MRENIFVDTSAWLALANTNDKWHQKARQIRQNLIEQDCKFWVSEYVIVEIGNSLSRISFRQIATNLIDSIIASKEIKLIHINYALFNESWHLYKERHDKEWSLTDCTSLKIMTKYRIKTAFTNDHHFEQAGFQILLK